jgi:hypothetical protein
MTATTGNPCWLTFIAAGDTSMENVERQKR